MAPLPDHWKKIVLVLAIVGWSILFIIGFVMKQELTIKATRGKK